MKSKNNVTIQLIVTVVIFSFLFLTGCVSQKQKFQDDMKAQGVNPLTGAEITKLFSNAKENGTSPKFDFEILYSADGKATGKVWGSWGEQTDDGEWRVSEDGLFCVKYLGTWKAGGERCYDVYPGNTDTDYTLIRITGSESKGFPSGVKPIKVTPRT